MKGVVHVRVRIPYLENYEGKKIMRFLHIELVSDTLAFRSWAGIYGYACVHG